MHGCVRATYIKKHIAQCLDLWCQEKLDALISDITTTSLANAGYCSTTNDINMAVQKYQSAVLDECLHAAVCGFTSCKGSSVLGPDDSCTKTGHCVCNVLAEQHRALCTPNFPDPNNLAFSDHGKALDIIPIDCPPVMQNALHISSAEAQAAVGLMQRT